MFQSGAPPGIVSNCEWCPAHWASVPTDPWVACCAGCTVSLSMMEDSEEGASQLHSLRFTQAEVDAAAEYLTSMFLVCAWSSVHTQLGGCS